MPRKLLRRVLPDQATLRDNALLRRCAPWLGHHALWHLNRSSVARGLALGLFCGMIPGPLQMLSATVLAIVLRVNLPVAIFGTFLSNPFTIVPLYLLAFTIGAWLTGGTGATFVMPAMPISDWAHPLLTLQAWGDWMLALGTPLFVGIVVLALLLAAAGYLLVIIGWRLHVILAWRARRRSRAAANAV